MYKLIRKPNAKYLTMVFEPDFTFPNVEELFRHVYEQAQVTMQEALWFYAMDEIYIGQKLYQDGYEVNYPFNPLDLFDLPNYGDSERKGIKLTAVSFEEGGIALVYTTKANTLAICYQSDDEWEADQKLIETSTFNPYWLLGRSSYMFRRFAK